MFIWFHNKGQLAPVFIVTLVVLLIMAFLTVNLGKVAFIKTDSANAVDAGSLAGGSAMANAFNIIAAQNAQLYYQYWKFFFSVSVSFLNALRHLQAAAKHAKNAGNIAGSGAAGSVIGCASPCSRVGIAEAAAAQMQAAIAETVKLIKVIMSIQLAVTGFWLAQYGFYYLKEKSIVKMAKANRLNAITLAHRFTYMNSGIGVKLREGAAPEKEKMLGKEDAFNYREPFSDFLKGLGSGPDYQYAWLDGQGREHSVSSKVRVDPVDTYDLKVTVLPFPAEIAIISWALSAAEQVLQIFIKAKAIFEKAAAQFKAACAKMLVCLAMPNFPPGPKWACIALAIAACGAAANTLANGGLSLLPAERLGFQIVGSLMIAWAGLAPGPIIRDKDGGAAFIFIIAWIDDIIHNRLLRVDSDQSHQGADLEVWQSRYPATHSDSTVNF